MIKTYIYAKLDGFELYEKDPAYRDYLQSFYNNSRQGRRMMVNRRPNGETTYNYIYYGIHEYGQRPTNAFFGMTLVLTDGQYCPNFKLVLKWFDMLFQNLLDRNATNRGRSGFFMWDETTGKLCSPLRFRVHKMDESIREDAEWLKSNLPNIFNAPEAGIANYDATFTEGKVGFIKGISDDEVNERILEEFRRYNWIALSSEYVVATSFELSYLDLKKSYNTYNGILAKIAFESEDVALRKLEKMDDEVGDIQGSIREYLSVQPERGEDGEAFRKLYDDFEEQAQIVNGHIKRIHDGQHSAPLRPAAEEKTCMTCKKQKPLSAFRASDATSCVECESKKKKVCVKCRKKKPLSEFEGESKMCRTCSEKEPTPQEDSFEEIFKDIRKWFAKTWKVMALVVFAILSAGVIWFLVSKLSAEDEVSDSPTTRIVPEDSQTFDEEGFTQALVEKRFDDALEMTNILDTEERKTALEDTIRECINDALWEILDKLGEFNSDAIYDEGLRDVINKNYVASEKLGITTQTWSKTITDYGKVHEALKQGVITHEDRERLLKITDEYAPRLNSSADAIKSIKLKEEAKQDSSQKVKAEPSKEVVASRKSQVTVSCGGKMHKSDSKPIDITMKSGETAAITYKGKTDYLSYDKLSKTKTEIQKDNVTIILRKGE